MAIWWQWQNNFEHHQKINRDELMFVCVCACVCINIYNKCMYVHGTYVCVHTHTHTHTDHICTSMFKRYMCLHTFSPILV